MKGFAVLEHSFLPFWAFFAWLFAPRWHLCLRSTNARIQSLIVQARILRSRIDASRIVPTPQERAELIRTTVQRILKDEGVHPLPGKARKKPPIEWTTFVHSHMATLIVCDFFSKPVWTLCGKKQAYVLVFIHLGSRKTFCSPPTYSPDGDWILQQARNASMWLDDIGVKPRFLIHDRDGKYPGSFSEFWKTEGVRCIRIPPRAPMANCFAENFTGKLKRECLDHFVCFSLGHLQHIVATWISYWPKASGGHNSRRPHQGFDIGNEVLDENFKPQMIGELRCKEELGGIIKSYYRKAA